MNLNDYQKKALTTAINHPKPDYVFFDRVFGLVGEAGEMAEKVKKWIRDDKADPAMLDKEAMSHELGDIFWYLAAVADYLGYSLEEIAQNNLDRLQSRQKRGKITGSGDTR